MNESQHASFLSSPQKHLHQTPFTPDTFYTRHLLNQRPFTPDTFYTTNPFTPDTFYTRRLLHQTPFTFTDFYTTPFTPNTFYIKHLLHYPRQADQGGFEPLILPQASKPRWLRASNPNAPYKNCLVVQTAAKHSKPPP